MITASVAALLSTSASAQAPGGEQSSSSKNQWGVWSSFSFANGHVFGFAQDRSLQRFSLRYGRKVWETEGIRLRYMMEAVPAAIVGEPRVALLNGHAAPGSPVDHVYGAGLSPVGAQMNFATSRKLQPFLTTDGGFLYFSRKLLSSGATQFNFTIHVSTGVEVFVTPRKAVDVGYMFHHFSNANLGSNNPGLDAHMIFVGLSFF